MRPWSGRPFQRERLRYDSAFRTEVAYCAEHGIPHSEFLRRWSNVDRAKLVAHLIDKSERCTLCGTADWEWIEDPAAYEPMWHECMGCRHKDGFRVAEGEQQAAGRSVVLKSREEAEKLRYNPAAVPRHGPKRRRPRPRRQS